MRIVLVGALLAAAACQNPPEPYETSLDGQWNFSHSLRDTPTQYSHDGEGRLTIQHRGTAFTGSGLRDGRCITGGTPTDTPLSGARAFQLASGRVVASGETLRAARVSFSDGICEYSGTVSIEDWRDRMAGTMSCSYALDGVTHTYAGDWSATRWRLGGY